MKAKRIINFKAVGLSLLFIFNPNINIIDIFPDFIGYILLCTVLTGLADMNDTVSEAVNMFKRMIFIDAGKMVAMLWVFGISVVSERNSSLMLWAFVFGVLEIILVVPAFIKLFKGLSELGFLYENTSVVATVRKNGKKNRTDSLRNFTVFFISLKAVMSFLPEFADLTSTEYYENAGLINLYRYIGIMRVMAVIPVIIVGLIWIIRCIFYFNRINRDTPFTKSLEELYAERVAPKKGIFVRRNIAVTFAVLLTALFFSFDFRMESVNMLPDFVCGVLIIAFFICASKRTSLKIRMPLVIAGAYTLVSLWAYISEFMFFKEYYYGAIDRSTEARNAFVLMSVSVCVSAVLFVVMCLLVLKAVKEIVDTHTGVIAISDTGSETQKKMSDDIKAELGKYIKICAVLTLVYAITDICYVLLAKDYSFMFLINVMGAAACILSYAKLYLEVSEAVKSRYILE